MGEGKNNSLKEKMTPLWQSRSIVAVIFLSIIYPILWLRDVVLGSTPVWSVDGIVTILSLSALTIGLLCHFGSHKTLLLRLAYILLVCSVVANVTLNGYIELIDATIWGLLGMYAGVFGLATLAGVLVVSSSYLMYLFIYPPDWFDPISGSLIILFPILIGVILWRQGSYLQSEKERKLASLQNQLGTEANKSNIVIQAINDGVVVIGQDNNIDLMNPAASALLGWEINDAIGLDYELIIKLRTNKEGELKPASHPVKQSLSSNRPVSRNDCEIISASNRKTPVMLHVSPLGEIGSGVVMVFRDITDEMLDNRQKAEFISTASHEMRTPVASIEGYIGLALNPQTASIDDKARSYLIKAQESAQHLGRLFQDLLNITRAEDGRLNIYPSVVNLTDTMREYTEILRPYASQKQLRLVFMPDHSPGTVNSLTPVYYAKVDRDHLREIMTNLIENAIKYTLHGEVSINISGDTEHVVISVKDTGIGIDKEHISHVFEKFYRIDNSDTREIGGTGLGLYLCRRLAEAMGGRLWVESRQGEGSEFFLELSRLSDKEAGKLLSNQANTETSNSAN